MDDLIRTTIYDELNDRVINRVTYDNSALLEQNAVERSERQGSNKYRPEFAGMVKVASISMGDIERLKNIGYDLFSPDRDEVHRALLYIQSAEYKLMCVEGTPIARKKIQWQ